MRAHRVGVVFRREGQAAARSEFSLDGVKPLSVYYDVVAELLEDDLIVRHQKIMARYLKCDLLIIDDMGIKQLPPKSGEYLFEIVMRRYEVKSTMMTSNRPLEEWGKLIGDVPAATAILDRFLHHAQLVKIKGKSYRMRNQACPTTE